MRVGKPAKRTVRTRWPVAVVSALLALYALVPTDASADSDVAPPPGDCWGGVLSGDPLHCYVFEEAQKAGLMEIDAMYLSPGLAPLYIYLKQSELASAELLKFLRDKTYEYVAQPADEAVKYIYGYGCSIGTGNSWYRCVYKALDYPDWTIDSSMVGLRLPKSLEYPAIVLRVGGGETRRSVPGWGVVEAGVARHGRRCFGQRLDRLRYFRRRPHQLP